MLLWTSGQLFGKNKTPFSIASYKFQHINELNLICAHVCAHAQAHTHTCTVNASLFSVCYADTSRTSSGVVVQVSGKVHAQHNFFLN